LEILKTVSRMLISFIFRPPLRAAKQPNDAYIDTKRPVKSIPLIISATGRNYVGTHLNMVDALAYIRKYGEYNRRHCR